MFIITYETKNKYTKYGVSFVPVQSISGEFAQFFANCKFSCIHEYIINFFGMGIIDYLSICRIRLIICRFKSFENLKKLYNFQLKI